MRAPSSLSLKRILSFENEDGVTKLSPNAVLNKSTTGLTDPARGFVVK